MKGRENWEIPIAFACVLLGIMMTLQFRTQKREGFPLYNQRTDLIKMVNELERQRNKLETDLAEKKKKLEEFEQAAGKDMSTVKAMQDQLETARMEAGILPMKGPGLIVEIADSPKSPSPKEDPYYFIVHDVDLDTLVNELWAAGAEAIAVNDQRIVTTTSIRCVGPTVLVNAVRLASPYKIKVLGPTKDMEGGLRTPGGYMDYMAPAMQRGVTVRINRYEEIEMPEFKGSLIFRYAKPLKKELP
jgi:uncharacterized protein YlxW (UPF0749 family)